MEQERQEKAVILDGSSINRAISRISYEILERNKGSENICIIAIMSGGLNIASKIAAKINELDELKKEKEALIKSVLDTAGVEEMKIGAFTVRFTNIVRNNFNTTAFKKKYLELYNAFIKQSNYRKFTIA